MIEPDIEKWLEYLESLTGRKCMVLLESSEAGSRVRFQEFLERVTFGELPGWFSAQDLLELETDEEDPADWWKDGTR